MMLLLEDPIVKYPQACILGTLVRVELGYEEELQQAGRQQNPARLWPLRWEKGPIWIEPGSSSF
jgi:hypothetical protein